jgi:IS30 family transposase
VEKHKREYMSNKGKKYKSYKRLTEEKKEMIYKLFEEKMELRKIARVIGVNLGTIQYHIKKAQRV